MKKTILLTILFCLFSTFAYSNNIIRVTAPPSLWAWEKGNTLEGPIIDLTTSIFSELRLISEPVPLPWPRAIKYMKSGELDAMLVIYYTEERSKFIDYTISYTDIPISVFVPKGRSFPFERLEDLIGKKGVVVRGEMFGEKFENFRHRLNIYNVDSLDIIVRELDKGYTDYAVYQQYGLIAVAKRLSLLDRIEILPKHIDHKPIHIGFSKKSSFLKYIPQINKKIKQLKEDGIIEKIIKNAMSVSETK